MGAPGLTSPIRSEGFEKLELNAGVFIPNFDMSEIDGIQTLQTNVASRITAGTTLGMTSGGGTFTVTRESRTPEVDGRRYPHKGAQFIDSLDAHLSSTLVEITGDNWVKVIGTAELASGKYKIKTAIDSGAYLTNLVWAGDLADGRFVAIEISNALNTADIAFTFADKNEGKLPFEFHAHQATVLAYDEAPFKVYFFEGDALATKSTANVSTKTAMPPQPFDGNYMSGSSLKKGKYMISFSCSDLKSLLNNGYTLSVSINGITVSVETNHIVTGDIYHVPIVLTQIESAVWRASATKPDGKADKTISLKNFAIIDQTSLGQ